MRRHALSGRALPERSQRAQTVTSGGLFGATRHDAGGRDKLNFQMSMAGAFDSEVPPELRNLSPVKRLSAIRPALVAGSADFERNRRQRAAVRQCRDAVQICPWPRSDCRRESKRPPRARPPPAEAGEIWKSRSRPRIPRPICIDCFQQSRPASRRSGSGEPRIPNRPDRVVHLHHEDGARVRLRARHSPDDDGRIRPHQLQATALSGRPNVRRTRPAPGSPRRSHASSPLSAGYDYEAGEFGVGALAMTHRATMGVEYSPPLSVTRRVSRSGLTCRRASFRCRDIGHGHSRGRAARVLSRCRARRASITRSG